MKNPPHSKNISEKNESTNQNVLAASIKEKKERKGSIKQFSKGGGGLTGYKFFTWNFDNFSFKTIQNKGKYLAVACIKVMY